jgi:DNA adenine methylase
MLHIEILRRLNNLIELKNKNIKFYSTQYDLVPIPENSVIYCDIPYKGTFDYGMDFDYEKFYKWAKNQNNIFISEYDMPNDFVCVKKIYKECSFAKNNSNLTIEKLFIPKR